jgi:hypothetical protein
MHSLEDIKLVSGTLNEFINSQKALIPEHQHEKLCKSKSELDCMNRWLYI